MQDSTANVSSVHESVTEWLSSPKTWIAGAALLFTLGGSAALFHESLIANDLILKETHKVMMDHQMISSTVSEANKVANEQSQKLLQEIVRVAKVNCINTSRDDVSRRACVGTDQR